LLIHFARGVVEAAGSESCCRQSVDDFFNMRGIPGFYDNIGICPFDGDVIEYALMVKFDNVASDVTNLLRYPRQDTWLIRNFDSESRHPA